MSQRVECNNCGVILKYEQLLELDLELVCPVCLSDNLCDEIDWEAVERDA